MACGRGKGGAESGHGTAAARTGSELRPEHGEGGAGPWPGAGLGRPSSAEGSIFFKTLFSRQINNESKINKNII